MADRIFGPIRGAGTQVREKEPEKTIVPGPLGSTVLVGVFERGKENDITIVPGKRALIRRMGGMLDPADFNACAFASLEASMAAQQFWDHSQGGGILANLRIVPQTNNVTNDDRPDRAKLLVFNREDAPKYLGYLLANNGGRWAGQREIFLGEVTGVPGTDFPNPNQLQLDGLVAKDFKRDEWKGATCRVHGITTKTYEIVSNSSDGLLTFAADVDLPTDWAAAGPPVDLDVTIERDNLNARGQEKYLSVEFKDGTLDPVGFFGMQVRVDGEVLIDWENLSMDTNSPYYWQSVVNDDPNNDLVEVVDEWTGSRMVETARPANRYGLSKALTVQQLTIADPDIALVSTTVDWVPTLTWTTWGSKVVPQRLKVEVTDDLTDAIKVTTDIGNREYTGTLGVSLVTGDDYIGTFTAGAGTGTITTGDYFYVYLRPLYESELVGGQVNPNTASAAPRLFSIVSNTRTTVTIAATQDLTAAGVNAAGDAYLLRWPERFGQGYDGYIAGMTSADFEGYLEYASSPLKKLKTMNWGLVKAAIPGIAKPSPALDLQKKLRELCTAYNWMHRVEVPDEYLAEEDVLDWVNNSLGRLDLSVVYFPSFGYIRDPFAASGSEAREVLVSLTGMQLGREAMIATQNEGYHKATAGVGVTLPLVLRMPVLGRPDRPVRLNEELLNPAGINAYRWASGGSVIIAWGDRSLDSTTAMRWKHKREQLSYYENIMLENFDWNIFEINDPEQDAKVKASVHDFFLPEYRKRAIRGTSFVGGRNPALIVKMDAENNTDATRAQGNQNCEISLRLADVVERLQFTIGVIGLTESI